MFGHFSVSVLRSLLAVCLLCVGFELRVSPVALVRPPRELFESFLLGGDYLLTFSFFIGWNEVVFRC